LTACGDTATSTPVATTTVAAAATATKAVTTAATTAAAPHWEYDGTEGPAHWGDLDGYAVCKTGQQQSPIDITKSVKLSPPQALTLNYKDSAISLVNNGHTAQVNYDKGSSMSIGGKSYDLVQFHFHDPSEHTINGVGAKMEIHLVHQNAADKSLAVIGVMLQEGAENPLLAKFWDSIPASAGTANPSGTLNISAIVPSDSHFYTYAGSLTTPPCSEGVKWIVMKQPMTVSKAQADKFTSIFGKTTARPVQPLNSRDVSDT
jgi:carbonic anhydrase